MLQTAQPRLNLETVRAVHGSGGPDTQPQSRASQIGEFIAYRPFAVQRAPDTQRLGDAPRLRDAAHRRCGASPSRISDTLPRQASRRWSRRAEQFQRGCPIAVHPEVGLRVGAQQPGPDRALVIAAVAAHRIAAVVAAIGRIVGTERPRARPASGARVRPHRQRWRPRALEQRIRQRDREDLVRSQPQLVAVRTIDNVRQIAEIVSEEARTETVAHALGRNVIVGGGCITARMQQRRDAAQARCTRAPGSRPACRCAA